MRAILYTWSTCRFCLEAKQLLDRYGIAWEERALDGNPQLVERLAKAFEQRTMPFVLLDDEPIGGLAELQRMADEGRLS